jgi:hypothetical protein
VTAVAISADRTATAHPSIRALLIRILHDVPSEMWGVPSHAGSTFVIVFAEKRSLEGQAIHFAKMKRKCHLPHVRKDVWSNQLVANNMAPNT